MSQIDLLIAFIGGLVVGAYLGVICMALMEMRGRDNDEP